MRRREISFTSGGLGEVFQRLMRGSTRERPASRCLHLPWGGICEDGRGSGFIFPLGFKAVPS